MAIDFFLVPTLTFRLLFVFVVVRHVAHRCRDPRGRWQVVHDPS
ncbi:MAG TPA: hypothetical protein VNS56_14820 [Methylomirabilota bacterium]|nr:hypothetical protein [Methylomirabilota bacterium]